MTEKDKYIRLFASVGWDSDKLIQKGYVDLEKVVNVWDGEFFFELLDGMYQEVRINGTGKLYKKFLAVKRYGQKFVQWNRYNRKINSDLAATMSIYRPFFRAGVNVGPYQRALLFYLFASFLIINDLIKEYQSFASLTELNETMENEEYELLSNYCSFKNGRLRLFIEDEEE